MSFDLMVFDADIAPKDKKGFREWFEQEAGEQGPESSDLPEICKNDAFRAFYEQMAEVFTPFNGPDAVHLPENASQLRILRTGEYSFRRHSAYMCFGWPAQDFARAACSTFSKELGLGFYMLSTRYPQVRFPDGTYVYPHGNWKDEELKDTT